MVKEPAKNNENGKKPEKANQRSADLTLLATVLSILVLLNVISGYFYKRIDITEDRRYTLTEKSREIVKGIGENHMVFVRVYLDGEMPPGFKKLSNATRDLLDELRHIAGSSLQYEFINPNEAADERSRRLLHEQLGSQGLKDYTVQENLEAGTKRQVLFPGAIVSLNGMESIAVNLLQDQVGMAPEAALNFSEMGLEYQIVSAIHRLKKKEKKHVAFIQGHGELGQLETKGAAELLGQEYEVHYINLPEYKVGVLDTFSMVIVAKPTQPFSLLEKYKLDQYLMRGGKIMWFVEGVHAELDSLYRTGEFVTTDNPTQLYEDFLFTYGIRVNYDVVQDLNSHFIPLMSASYGSQQRANMVKWPYYPIVSPRTKHPIVNNLGPVWLQFAGTLDTLSPRLNPDVRKTVLLSTSPASRRQLNPASIDLKLVRRLKEEQQLYSSGPYNVAVLLEGEFNSAFSMRPPTEEVRTSGEYGEFKTRSPHTGMVVVSDGNAVGSQVQRTRQLPLPLGYDMYSGQQFSNDVFLLNSADYLINGGELLTLRDKEFKLRLLDKNRVRRQEGNWQLANTVVPVVAVFLFGVVYNYVRRRRFAN